MDRIASTLSLSPVRDASLSVSLLPVLLPIGWLVLCAALRHRRERDMRVRYGYPDRASLGRMTNTDAQAILQELAEYEFPHMSTLALQLALFKTYAFPEVSALLVRTRQLWAPGLAPKRYEDTTVLFAEFMLNPPTSARHLRAIARINFLHRPFVQAGRIRAEDFVYTLAVCIIEPVRFYRRLEWREPNEMEIAAIATLWKCVADGLAIDYRTVLAKSEWHDGLEFYHDISAWARQFEIRDMCPSEDNARVGATLVDMLLFHVPGLAKPFARQVLCALMGDRVREAFCFPEPGIAAIAFGPAALCVRRLFLRHLCLPRFFPKKSMSDPDPATGRIRHYEYLVEPWYHPATAWTRWGPAAWLTRAMGGPVPGDGGAKYMPQGYLFEEIGPDGTQCRGMKEMGADEAVIAATGGGRGGGGRAGCPFATL